MISRSKEATTPENEQIQSDVRELRKELATIQDSNDGTRKTILIGMAFFCLFLIFKPGPLGFSMYDLASVDCDIDFDFDDGVWYENADCVAERNTEQFQVAILGIISLACFFAALKKPESEEEEPVDPLEKNKETLKRKKIVEKWSGAIVLIICIYCFSLIITATGEGDVLMIRNSLAIMALANIIGYFVLIKSREQITEIQDSITEMEEE